MSSSVSVVCDKRFLNNPTPFLHFCGYLPFQKNLALDLYKFEFPLPKDDLYQDLLKLACWFWRRRFKKKNSVNFYSFTIISPWGRGVSFI
jgi:hypothetical protein